jgi:hypothetical protein
MSRARTVTRDTVTGGFSEYYKNYKNRITAAIKLAAMRFFTFLFFI